MILEKRVHGHACKLRGLRAIAVALLVVAWGSSAEGAVYTVDSTADEGDASLGDGICATTLGSCTLRAAIQEVNKASGTINLPAGTYSLSLAGAGEDGAETGDLDVASNITINGAGASESIIDGGALDRVFEVRGILALNHLTVRNGMTSESGGGISSSGQLFVSDCIIEENEASDAGGGISSSGTLEVTRTTLRDNEAGDFGGGLASSGFVGVALRDSTIAGNQATSGGGLVLHDGSLSVVNSTLSGNHASADGGGAFVIGSLLAIVNVNDSTVTANVADDDLNGSGDGGGLAVTGASTLVEVSNTILADNLDSSGGAPDCKTLAGATLFSRGYNLIGDLAGCAFALSSDPTGNIIGPASLAALAANGGPTETHLPLPASPVRHAGNPATPGSGPYTCVTTDQRGFSRPSGPACDIGAVEAEPACGDGALDDGEACDDGNTANFDCCDSTCQPEPAEQQCDVDDGDPCTHEFCDGTGTCTHRASPWPESYCEASDLPGKARLNVADKTPDTSDKVVWKYTGEGVSFFHIIGEPEPTVFCIYDDDGIVLRAAVPGNLLCSGVPCWTYKDSSDLAKFKDKSAAVDGVQIIQSKALNPKGKALFKGKGAELDFTPPPWTGTVVAELTETVSGGCYTTTFASPKKNRTGQYSAKGD